MRITEAPEEIKPYLFHGIDLSIQGKEAVGDCPFCGGETKFQVNITTTKWGCRKCDTVGNATTFIRQLWEAGKKLPIKKYMQFYRKLAKDRGIMISTMRQWGVVPSIVDNAWILPGYNTKGAITQLYRFALIEGKHRWLATPTMGNAIFGLPMFVESRKTIHLCEGPWDGMRLQEELEEGKDNVLAIPGCNSFRPAWSRVFAKKNVNLLFDNDHPKKHPKTGNMISPAAYEGLQRVSGMLGQTPNQIQYLKWGPDGWTKEYPSGTDVRDLLNGKGEGMKGIISRLTVVPKRWLEERKQEEKKIQRPVECKDWEKLSDQWRQALYWTDGLDVTLSVMLACCASTDLPGEDQLWIKVIGPPSSGKSTLSEALSIARKYVIPKDTFTGLTSGFQGEDNKDYSLVSKLDHMTLIINDGDTLLQMPNLDQIISQLRAFYGRNIRVQYRNKRSKDHEGISTTIILCGTKSLKSLDQSELGERFLDCVVMEDITESYEDRVLKKVLERENAGLGGLLLGDQESGDPKISMAKRMTAGYLVHLRETCLDRIIKIDISQRDLASIGRIAKFVARMRARPSSKQIRGSVLEYAQRELASRLASQHLRLAKCLALVLGEKTVSEEVMRRVVKVAVDTSGGVVYDLCEYLSSHEDGGELHGLILITGQSKDVTRKLLIFLKKIKVLEQFTLKSDSVRSKYRWRMTKRMGVLYKEIAD